MFAKVFTQILDSSLADDYLVRLVFEDFLKLASAQGIVDMTASAIARRTNVPLDVVLRGISVLEAADPNSRTPDEQGRRIIRLDPARSWGWRITNFIKYRESATQDMLRMGEAERKAEWRRRKGFPAPLPKPKEAETEGEAEAEMSRTCPGHVRDMSGTSNAKPPPPDNDPSVFRSRELWQIEKDIKEIANELAKLGDLSPSAGTSRKIATRRATLRKLRAEKENLYAQAMPSDEEKTLPVPDAQRNLAASSSAIVQSAIAPPPTAAAAMKPPPASVSSAAQSEAARPGRVVPAWDGLKKAIDTNTVEEFENSALGRRTA